MPVTHTTRESIVSEQHSVGSRDGNELSRSLKFHNYGEGLLAVLWVACQDGWLLVPPPSLH